MVCAQLTERERTIDISTGLSVPQKYERITLSELDKDMVLGERATTRLRRCSRGAQEGAQGAEGSRG